MHSTAGLWTPCIRPQTLLFHLGYCVPTRESQTRGRQAGAVGGGRLQEASSDTFPEQPSDQQDDICSFRSCGCSSVTEALAACWCRACNSRGLAWHAQSPKRFPLCINQPYRHPNSQKVEAEDQEFKAIILSHTVSVRPTGAT